MEWQNAPRTRRKIWCEHKVASNAHKWFKSLTTLYPFVACATDTNFSFSMTAFHSHSLTLCYVIVELNWKSFLKHHVNNFIHYTASSHFLDVHAFQKTFHKKSKWNSLKITSIMIRLCWIFVAMSMTGGLVLKLKMQGRKFKIIWRLLFSMKSRELIFLLMWGFFPGKNNILGHETTL